MALRAECRSEAFCGQTSGRASGFIQANFVALPFEHAFDFLQFALCCCLTAGPQLPNSWPACASRLTQRTAHRLRARG